MDARLVSERRQSVQPNANADADQIPGLHLVLGQNAGIMARNMVLNAQEGHVRVAQAVFERMASLSI